MQNKLGLLTPLLFPLGSIKTSSAIYEYQRIWLSG